MKILKKQPKTPTDLIAEFDTGARTPQVVIKHIMLIVLFCWAVFQLWIASPLPYMVSNIIPVFNNIDTRSIHLGFALFLGFLSFPAFATSPRKSIPIIDWVLAIAGVFSAMYLSIFADDLASVLRAGNPNTMDLIIASVGIIIVLEAARRTLGITLSIIASLFLLYVFFGNFAPDILAWKGASFARGMNHMWLTQEGVFGVAIGVSTTVVFLFVLFGALLERAGAGNYFIHLSYAFLGHLKGGPAKASVISSALTGIISGSSIGNVVTTGTFTIPLMKKMGFSAEKSGAIEVASSTNGQLTPPVMGAAAFLIIEFVGISYIEVVKHAILPAMISYIALIYIVHLEACKAGLQAKEQLYKKTIAARLLNFATIVLGFSIASLVLYYGFGWLKESIGFWTVFIAIALFLLVYIKLLHIASKYPDLGSVSDLVELPEPKPVVYSGLYFILPIIVLMWCLAVERFSPALSVFWAIIAMIFIVFTHKYIKNYFRNTHSKEYIKHGVSDFIFGCIAGSKNMIGIAIATAAAGIVVGSITLTGIGLIMADFVDLVSGGNLLIMLIFTAIISLILGMGLPTTANYIVVSSLMVPVIVTVGAENGLIVPLIAVHLFVFYFGILADDTPPVGLAAYAASAISGGNPIRTGVQGFKYDIRTAILPFMFIFNTELLLIDIEGFWHLMLVIISALIAMLAFASSTQNYFIVKNKIIENIMLLLATWILFIPSFFMNFITPEFKEVSANQLVSLIDMHKTIKLNITGTTIEGNLVNKTVILPLDGTTPQEKINNTGLTLSQKDEFWNIERVKYDSIAYKQKIEQDFHITGIIIKNERIDEHWLYIIALLLLLTVWRLQTTRRKHEYKNHENISTN
jgi:TRAP transporter 4TM/12TM fusion protein